MNYDIETLTPAPLNQKDILEDILFEQIFDDGNYIATESAKPHLVMGFIDDIPCMLEWSFNSHNILITPLKIKNNQSWTDEIIILRLTHYNDEPDCQTICDATEIAEPAGPYKISASYYYKPEESFS